MTDYYKLIFMDSLRHYIVTNGKCEFDLQDIYIMLHKNLYYGVFRKIIKYLRRITEFSRYDYIAHNTVNYFDDGSGTTVLSALDSNDSVNLYFDDNNITYHFRDNVHYIEVKNYPCDVICRGYQAGYHKEWIKLNKMIIDCSFSFINDLSPLSFSYKVDHLEPQERYKKFKDFNNLNMVLLQPDFQEDISMLVVKFGMDINAVCTKDVFTSLKFVQRISDEIPAGTCSYIVAPAPYSIYEDPIDNMPDAKIFNKIVYKVTKDDATLEQISRCSGFDRDTVMETLYSIQDEINKNAPGIQH